MIGSLGVVNHRNASREAGNNFLYRRQGKVKIIAEIQLAAPGIEQLHRRSTGRDLCLEIERCGTGNTMKQLPEGRRFAVAESFCSWEPLRGSPLDHVTRQRPGCGRKTKYRYFGSNFASQAANGFHQEGSLDLRIEIA